MRHQEREFTADALELAPIALTPSEREEPAPPARSAFPTLEMPSPPEVNAAPAAVAPPSRRAERLALIDPEELDLRGLQPPFALLRSLPALRRITPGAQLRIAVDGDDALRDFRDLCALHGHALKVLPDEPDGVHFVLTKR